MNNETPEYDNKPSGVLAQVINSFRFAFTGLSHVLLTQRNMRFHFSIALWVMSFAIIFDLDDFKKAFLFIIITFVFSLEVLNTCVEALVDLLSPEYDRHAEIAKDTAAAAVLCVSIGSVISAGYLLIPPFFTNIPDPAWLEVHTKEILSIALIVASVLIYWFVRAIHLFPRLFLALGCIASSMAISLLSVYGKDWLTFCALQFFSVLLFVSMARSRVALFISISGHIIGAITYFAIRLYIPAINPF
ncbi:diacylglycerol kinase family protein [bacterium]